MDDGFQHRWVKAGMNILLNNYENTIYSDSLIPLGKLRESKSGTSRADMRSSELISPEAQAGQVWDPSAHMISQPS